MNALTRLSELRAQNVKDQAMFSSAKYWDSTFFLEYIDSMVRDIKRYQKAMIEEARK